jgi:hypothetical protein
MPVREPFSQPMLMEWWQALCSVVRQCNKCTKAGRRGRNVGTRSSEFVSGALQFRMPNRRISDRNGTNGRRDSCAPGMNRGDLGGDDAEGDAIPTIAQRKIRVRKTGMDTDISQAVFRFAESACPGISHFQRQIRKQSPELFNQGSSLLRNQRVPALRIHEIFVFAADDDTPSGCGPQIEVWRATFPNKALLMPT